MPTKPGVWKVVMLPLLVCLDTRTPLISTKIILKFYHTNNKFRFVDSLEIPPGICDVRHSRSGHARLTPFH